MTASVYLKIDPIVGTSTHPSYRKWIELVSFSLDTGSNNLLREVRLYFQVPIDKAGNRLLWADREGTKFAKAILAMSRMERGARRPAQEIFRIELTEVTVVNVHLATDSTFGDTYAGTLASSKQKIITGNTPLQKEK